MSVKAGDEIDPISSRERTLTDKQEVRRMAAGKHNHHKLMKGDKPNNQQSTKDRQSDLKPKKGQDCWSCVTQPDKFESGKDSEIILNGIGPRETIARSWHWRISARQKEDGYLRKR